MTHDQPSREDHAQTVLDLVAPESLGLTLPPSTSLSTSDSSTASRRPEAAAGTDASR